MIGAFIIDAEINVQIDKIVNPFPNSTEEWVEFGDILYYEFINIETLKELVLPGYADFKSAINKFKNDSYWGASFDLTMAIIDFIPVGKVADTSIGIAKMVRRASKVLDAFNVVKRLGNTRVYNGFNRNYAMP